jgi:sugar phosphate isomerase/epimerase
MQTKNLTRREALAALAATLSPIRAAGAAYKPKVVAQTYIWAHDFRMRNIPLADGLEETFSTIRKTGYHRVELMSDFLQGDLRPKTIAVMKNHKLTCSMVYYGGPMHEDAGAGKTIGTTLELAEAAQSIGAAAMVHNPNPLPKGGRKSDEELRVQAGHVNRLGRQLQSRGMRLVLHHHGPEMRENAREWRHLLNNTDPQLVWICLDADWVRYGKQDVMGLLKECGPRLGSVHLRNTQNCVWMEDLGPGDIDYAAVAAYLKESKFAGDLVVELGHARETKVTHPMAENLRRSREFTEKTFGVKA